jgi:hypothetical protein
MEILTLRHQIQVLHRSRKRPRLTRTDRGLWLFPSRIWHDWRDGLSVVKPDTVVRLQSHGLNLYWRWKSRKRKRGRPLVSLERETVQMFGVTPNSLWARPL